MVNVPFYVSALFMMTTLVTVVLFFFATAKNKTVLGIVFVLIILQTILAFQSFYHNSYALPPRVMFMLLPSTLLILFAFFSQKGKEFIEAIDLKTYTYLHTVRIAVEFVIFWLFVANLMPESMTFEGRNFDIFSGITAPIVAYFGFNGQKTNKTLLLIWNFICLALVLQVVGTGILSAPSPFQTLSLAQPNVAVFYFPFVFLPTIVVPIVIFGHLVAIKRLLKLH